MQAIVELFASDITTLHEGLVEWAQSSDDVFSNEIQTSLLEGLERHDFSELFAKETDRLQGVVILLLIRIYGRKLTIYDLFMLFDEDFDKSVQNLDENWNQVQKVFERCVQVLLFDNIIDSSNQWLGSFTRLLLELLQIPSYFNSEQHMLSEFCVIIQVLSETVVDFGSQRLDIYSIQGAHRHGRILTCLDFIKGICSLLPGDGFEFRAFLAIERETDFVSAFCMPYLNECWSLLHTANNMDDIKWQELVDYDTCKFYYYSTESGESTWRKPLKHVSTIYCRTFEYTLELLISLAYVPSIQRSILKRDCSAALLSLKLQEGYFHRQISWLLLFNVACCFDTEMKTLKNQHVIDSFLASLSVDERVRIATAFCADARFLPVNDVSDSLAFNEMYMMLIEPRSVHEDPNKWMYCLDPESGGRYFCQLYNAATTCVQSQWERPTVSACAWTEYSDDQGNTYYQHSSGNSQWELPTIPSEKTNEPPDEPPCSTESEVENAFRLLGNLPSLQPTRRREPECKTSDSTVTRRHKAPHSSIVRDLPEEKYEQETIPSKFKCLLSKRVMTVPVVSPLGHVFDKKAISLHLFHHFDLCPISDHRMTMDEFIEDKELRMEILSWQIRNQTENQIQSFDIYEF